MSNKNAEHLGEIAGTAVSTLTALEVDGGNGNPPLTYGPAEFSRITGFRISLSNSEDPKSPWADIRQVREGVVRMSEDDGGALRWRREVTLADGQVMFMDSTLLRSSACNEPERWVYETSRHDFVQKGKDDE